MHHKLLKMSIQTLTYSKVCSHSLIRSVHYGLTFLAPSILPLNNSTVTFFFVHSYFDIKDNHTQNIFARFVLLNFPTLQNISIRLWAQFTLIVKKFDL